MEDIGLFPLGMVLLPHERVPLHIFEERYKELIEECIDGERPFGLILAKDDDQADIGTLAVVHEVTRRFPDGRLNIAIEGTSRFRIVEQTSGRAFATARVEVLPPATDDATQEEIEALLAAFAELAEAAEAEAPTVSTEDEDLSFRVAALVELENGPRQELLELPSERERTQYLTRLFSQLARNAARQREVRGRAESNGRVEPRD
jgi:Lon protease-like protein